MSTSPKTIHNVIAYCILRYVCICNNENSQEKIPAFVNAFSNLASSHKKEKLNRWLFSETKQDKVGKHCVM